MWEAILLFLGEWAVELGSAAAILAITEYVFAPFRSLRARFRKPEKVEIANPDALAPIRSSPTAPTEPVITLTLEQYEGKLRARADEVRAEMDSARAEGKVRLQEQLDELNRQLAEPDKALAEAQERIRDLEARLAREGNEIGAERLEAARKALEAGDYSVADELFAGIEAEEQIAVARAARAAFSRGEIAEAEVRWGDAAGHYARAAGLNPEFDVLFKAREFAWRSGDFAGAMRLGEGLLTLARKEADEIRLATALNEHALTLKATGRYGEAEPLFREAMEITGKTPGKDHPDYATRLNNLALLLSATGRYGEAEPVFREAMAIRERALGKDHPDYAQSLNNLAGLLEATGRYGEAEPLFREAMEITGKTLGKDHPDYAARLNNLAVLYANQKRFDTALPLMQQALATREAKLGPEHPNTLSSRRSLEAMRAAAEKPGAEG